ncbi:class I SAM-dependent methyltransferase [Saccharopolyspora erythraea]|uniref:class I SAM-dependent methyltransferase n=1 Tax=Saccharopolyspora erythraea TaxID=1836 RepID=UPI001BA6AAC2|nr:class I SAM-dependent methyltransferase [Saccharopolyspora erythraea]QUH03360.1 class I SAM-dependent methyltransferase [Saccharopolyspora erythraea]
MREERQIGGSLDQLVANPFDSDAAARRYARGRPYYHRTALRLAMRQLRIERAGTAVDLGCGTGLSTRALRDVADRVVALDVAPAMLRAAQRYPGVQYVVSGAERIPLRDACADLVTAGAAFHWFDQARVLPELARVLDDGAALAVYSDFFTGRLAGRPAFTRWFRDSYLARHPAPPRHHLDTAAAADAGFSDALDAEDRFRVRMSRSELADYLLSQSNAAAAVRSGAVTAHDLRREITDGLRSCLDGEEIDALFGVRVWTAVLRR